MLNLSGVSIIHTVNRTSVSNFDVDEHELTPPACIRCDRYNRLKSRFCSYCGAPATAIDPSTSSPCASGHQADLSKQALLDPSKSELSLLGERKYVTILFSDVAGYTAICEHMDPEDVQELMSRLFSKIVRIIVNYAGYVERIIGDEVLAVFGIPAVHEDDALRAVAATMEIHRFMDAAAIELSPTLDHPIAMHSGITSGFVITGKVDYENGQHGTTGYTIARASQLTGMAAAGEIFLDQETFDASSGFFKIVKTNRSDKMRMSKNAIYKAIGPLTETNDGRWWHGIMSRMIGCNLKFKKAIGHRW